MQFQTHRATQVWLPFEASNRRSCEKHSEREADVGRMPEYSVL